MLKEDFKIKEQTNKQYEITYTSTESNVSAGQVMHKFSQMDNIKKASEGNLREFEPYVIEARKNLLQLNIELLEKQLKENPSEDKKKQLTQRQFEITLLEDENTEKRKEQIRDEIKKMEVRMKEIEPHLTSIKLKLATEAKKLERTNKEARKKIEDEKKNIEDEK